MEMVRSIFPFKHFKFPLRGSATVPLGRAEPRRVERFRAKSMSFGESAGTHSEVLSVDCAFLSESVNRGRDQVGHGHLNPICFLFMVFVVCVVNVFFDLFDWCCF